VIATAILLTVVTAVAASWWPARSAARIPVAAALSGRPPRPQPGHRFAVPGGLLLAAGLGCLAFADDNGGIPPLVVAGTVTTTLGILFIAPLGIAALAAAGRRSPIAVRLALRDLVRYQARSGAALAAITLAVGIAATVVIAASQAATQAAQAAPAAPNLPANQLIVYISSAGARFGVAPVPAPAQLQALRARVTALAATLHARGALALDSATDPKTPSQPPQGDIVPAGRPTVALVKTIPSCTAPGVEGAGYVYLATPALLRYYVALLGALLGTAVAYLALIAWHRSNLGTLASVPVVNLIVIVIGLPLAASIVGGLLAGRQPPTIARQPLE
jgi:putative ABC transport system permease protein